MMTLCFAFLLSQPAPMPADRFKTDEVPPKLEMHYCNWGKVTQKGRDVTITGDKHWEASGYFRNGGELVLIWTNSRGNIAPGIYHYDAGSWVGSWGWIEDVRFNKDGSLGGELEEHEIFDTGEEP